MKVHCKHVFCLKATVHARGVLNSSCFEYMYSLPYFFVLDGNLTDNKGLFEQSQTINTVRCTLHWSQGVFYYIFCFVSMYVHADVTCSLYLGRGQNFKSYDGEASYSCNLDNEFCMLWFNKLFYPLFKYFIFLCFKLIIIYYHTPKQRKIEFRPRTKLNHNVYNVCTLKILYTGTLAWTNYP